LKTSASKVFLFRGASFAKVMSMRCCKPENCGYLQKKKGGEKRRNGERTIRECNRLAQEGLKTMSWLDG